MFDEEHSPIPVGGLCLDGIRRFGRYDTIDEKPTQCIAMVSPHDAWYSPRQCARNRGHGPDGLFCAQHAKMIEKAKGVGK